MSAQPNIDDLAAEQLSELPGLRGVHHVGIAVPNLDAAIKQWSLVLGSDAGIGGGSGHIDVRAVLESQGVEAVSIVVGTQVVELIAPHGESPSLRRFLVTRGSGLHHVAFAVDDVAVALAAAGARGLRVIDDVPRPGLHGTPVAFLHPSAVGGTLIELVEVRGEGTTPG